MIIVAIAVAAVIGAAFAIFILTDGSDERSFAVTYYKDGDKLLDVKVSAGTSVTIYGDMGISDDQGTFIGWNTKPDMSGKILTPGAQIKVNENTSLYAAVLGSGVYAVILPYEQKGFSITADPMYVGSGGSSILSYSLMPSHMEEELVIAVNGNPMKLDAMKRIHLSNITVNQTVTVTGVFDKREHSISLPEEQRGYVVTSSEEKVHHGESYVLEYTLLPGYRESIDFGFHVNGGEAKKPTDGTLLIEDVKDNHVITVTGVEPIEYNVSSGKNISVFVNGVPSSKATVEDIITILPEKDYIIPETFGSQIKGMFSVEEDEYRIASNVAFPSVLRITAGDNVKIDDRSSDTIFVCPEDTIRISPAYGYTLPSNYLNTAKNLNGVKYTQERFSFNDDAVLPSIYKVIFNGYNKVHTILFAVGGDECPFPITIPLRDFYQFERWGTIPMIVLDDIQIGAVWSPIEYEVVFGKNLAYSINGKYFSQPGSYTVTVEDFITINAPPGYELPSWYIPLDKVIEKSGGYFITSDYAFASIFCVHYMDLITGLSKKYYYSEFETHTIVDQRKQNNPLFTFDFDNTEYNIADFIGWIYGGQLYEKDTMIVEKDAFFFALWET